MAAKQGRIAKGIFAYLGTVLVFAFQPLTAVWATQYARKSFEKRYEDIREKSELLTNSHHNEDETGISPAKLLMMMHGLDDMPKFGQIDHWCGREDTDPTEDFFRHLFGREASEEDEPEARKSDKEIICASYGRLQSGKISRTLAVAVSPVIPILITLATAAILARRQRKKNLRAGFGAWILLKVVNKLVALQAAPFGLAIFFGCWAFGLEGWWATGAAFLIAAIFMGMQAATVEAYTNGVLEMEPEFEPPEFKAPAST